MLLKVSSEIELAKLAKDFARELSAKLARNFYCTVALIGELGAGKTTFTRYLVEALGSTQAVSSPSFVLAHEYRFVGGSIEHWDLYRLKESPPELDEPPATGTIRLIEWAERMPDFQSKTDVQIYFEFALEGEGRVVRVEEVSG